jgi:hypothetical protein
VIPAASLGLPAGANTDDISYGDIPFPPPAAFYAQFSVAPGSTGHPGSPPFPPHPNVLFEGPAGPPGGDFAVQGDIFASFDPGGGPLGPFVPAVPPSPCGPINSNTQSADENGLAPFAFGAPTVGLGLVDTAPGPPAGPIDDLDSLELLDNTFVDFAAPPGVLDAPVFFTVDPATAAGLPPLPPFFGANTGGDVLAFVPGTGLVKWATFAMLGLAPGDDIDALEVSYTSGAPIPGGWAGPPDAIVFSLAPGSPSNAGLGSACYGPGSGLPGDVYFDLTPAGPLPAPFIDAEMLGLNTPRSGGFPAPDDVDAIDFVAASGVDADADMQDDAADFDDDGDLFGDMIDNCPLVFNPGQEDYDGDSVGNACDATPGTPPQALSFSIPNPPNNTGLLGADILTYAAFGAPPVVGIPCGTIGGLGIPVACGPGGDDIAGLSYGQDAPIAAPPALYFSPATGTSPGPEGLPGSAVLTESVGCGPDQSASDEFAAPFPIPPPGAGHTNTLVLDENGLVDGGCGLGYPLGTGPVPGDNLDALVDLAPSYVDDGSIFGFSCAAHPIAAGDGLSDRPMYMTWAPFLPITGIISPADITVSCGGGHSVYVPAPVLGLISAPGCGPPACDAIDALLLNDTASFDPFSWEPGDEAWYSLAPGSPTLAALGASPADVLYSSGSAGGPFLLITGDQLGLNSFLLPLTSPFDDLDALKGHSLAGDTDLDGVADASDVCPYTFDPGQTNTDGAPLDNGPNVPGNDVTIVNGGDANGDACDTDDDNDGLTDVDELGLPGPACPAAAAPTDPLDMDSDGGHRTDGWECANGTDPNNPAAEFLGAALPDGDGDNIPGHWEARGYNSSDSNTDTDGNGCWDMVELASVDGNMAVTDADRLAVARRALNIPPFNVPIATQDYVLDIDKNGTVGDPDRLFVARAALLPAPWVPKSC